MQTADIDQIEVALVLEAIRECYGYDFRNYAKESISRRVHAARARSGVPHLGELIHRLLVDPNFFKSILSTLTVQVTDMFRDPAFYRAFRHEIVPVLRTYPEIKIWHAGCATGEEVYSMAILLMEEGLYDRAQIYGTDVDSSAIELARAGVYTQAQAKTFEANYLSAGGTSSFSNYATTAYERMSIHEGVRKNIVFFQHDLVTDFSLGEMHVVLCRNVAMYFNEPLRERVFGMFLECLVQGGFLCLGVSESPPRGSGGSFHEHSHKHRIFRRGDAT